MDFSSVDFFQLIIPVIGAALIAYFSIKQQTKLAKEAIRQQYKISKETLDYQTKKSKTLQNLTTANELTFIVSTIYQSLSYFKETYVLPATPRPLARTLAIPYYISTGSETKFDMSRASFISAEAQTENTWKNPLRIYAILENHNQFLRLLKTRNELWISYMDHYNSAFPNDFNKGKTEKEIRDAIPLADISQLVLITEKMCSIVELCLQDCIDFRENFPTVVEDVLGKNEIKSAGELITFEPPEAYRALEATPIKSCSNADLSRWYNVNPEEVPKPY